MAFVYAALPPFLENLFHKPPVWVQAWGYVLVLLVVLQLLIGYRIVKPPWWPFRRVHPAIAWGLVALLVPHAAFGIAHVVLTPLLSVASGHVHVGASPENMPVWLDVEGAVILVLLGAQIMAGNGAFKLKRSQFVSLHSTLAWSITAFVSLHAVLGIAHVLSG
jgi:hypothetical protein